MGALVLEIIGFVADIAIDIAGEIVWQMLIYRWVHGEWFSDTVRNLNAEPLLVWTPGPNPKPVLVRVRR